MTTWLNRIAAGSVSLLLTTTLVTTARADGPAPDEANPSPPAAAIPYSPQPNESRPYGELENTALRLAAAIGMPADRQQLALGRLRTAFQRGKVAAFAKGVGINGVFAYQMGEGGLLIKVKKGKGMAAILGAAGDVQLQLKSVTFGAQAGGGSEWGFGVVIGLKAREAFGGDYSGDSRGATAGAESVSITKLVKKGVQLGDGAYHEVYMVGAATGLSAGAAYGSLTITAR